MHSLSSAVLLLFLFFVIYLFRLFFVAAERHNSIPHSIYDTRIVSKIIPYTKFIPTYSAMLFSFEMIFSLSLFILCRHRWFCTLFRRAVVMFELPNYIFYVYGKENITFIP